MLKKDLKSMSFEDLVVLQKAVNTTIIDKRKNDFGSLVKEIKKLQQQKNDLDIKIKKVEDIFNELFFQNNFLKNIKNCNHYINSVGFLHIYIFNNHNHITTKSLDFDCESMKIVKNDGFLEEEIALIIEEIDLLLNNNSEKKNEE